MLESFCTLGSVDFFKNDNLTYLAKKAQRRRKSKQKSKRRNK